MSLSLVTSLSHLDGCDDNDLHELLPDTPPTISSVQTYSSASNESFSASIATFFFANRSIFNGYSHPLLMIHHVLSEHPSLVHSSLPTPPPVTSPSFSGSFTILTSVSITLHKPT